MRPSEALARHRGEMLAVMAAYPVSNPRVFGSVARGEDTEASDLDILVQRGEGLDYFALARLCTALSDLTGVTVDVRTEGEFRPVMLDRISRDFRPL